MELTRELPDWIDSWLQYMENSEAPTIYNKWVAVSMIAAALERKVFIRWEKILYPNFFIILVGPPGCRKGTAMGPGRDLLDEININIAADTGSREKLIDRLSEASNNFDALDHTIHPYSAMTIYSEEFTVFIGYGNAELMQNMANWYDCPKNWKYETKHQGTPEIDGVYVNLIGAITPELLQDALPQGSFGGGLNSRIIYVYAEKKSKIVLFPFELEGQEDLKQTLLRDLQSIRLMAGEYAIHQSYKDFWEEWYPDQQNIKIGNDGRMAGYIDRRPTHIHKLAMVMNASRNGNMTLTDADLKRATGWLVEVERIMPQAFEGVGRNPLASSMNKILIYMRAVGTTDFKTLIAQFYYEADERDMSIILGTLESRSLIKLERSKTSRNYKIHYVGDE